MDHMLNPNDIVSATFWLMSLAMAGATAFFFFEQRRVADRFKLSLAVMGAVTLISAIHYFHLREVWASTGSVSTLFRFADWQLTAPMQCVLFSLLLGSVAAVPQALFWRLLAASTVMVAAAYLGAADYMSPTLGFLVSVAGGLYVLGEIYLGEASKINASSENAAVQSAFNALRLIATIGWAVYPLGYFMEYLGGGVDPASLNVIYNLADFLNKITFGLIIHRAAVRDSTR